MTVAVPEGAAAAYEGLRPSLLDLSSPHGSGTGRVVLRRRGMLAWAHALETTPTASRAPWSRGAAAQGAVSSDITTDLVQLMATLILSHHTKEPGLCLN